MRLFSTPITIAIAVLAVACVYQGKAKPADTAVKKAVRFVEIDDRDRKFDLSGTDLQGDALLDRTAAATRVPAPRLVDINSTVEILIDRDKLASDESTTLTPARSEQLLAKKDRVLKAIVAIKGVVDLRRRTAAAFTRLKSERRAGADATAAWAEFDGQLQEFGRAENSLITDLLKEWQDDPDAFIRIDEAAKDPSYSKLQAVLQHEIDEIDTEHAKLAAEVEARSVEFRLTASLTSGKQRTQIHLPGYDDLDTGVVSHRDRFGIDLSPEEVARHEENWSKTVALAAAAEELRASKKALRKALRDAVDAVAPELGEALTAATALQAKVAAIDLPKFKQELDGDLKAFEAAIEAAASDLADDVERRAKAVPKAWAERVKAATAVAVLVGEVGTVAADWQNAKPADAINVAARSAALLTRLSRALKADVSAEFEVGKTAFVDVVTAELEGLTQDAIDRIAKLLPADVAARLTRRFGELREIWLAGKAVVAALGGVVHGVQAPVTGELVAPDARRIPVANITNTTLDLELTPRLPGDRVNVRAELFRNGEAKPFDAVEASFQPEYFGWNARLSPSVVLVRPTRLAASRETFSFAPVLSWMHSYRPRPEHDGFFDGVARALVPGIGIHASFLNFDPQKEVEIGLGGTLSFWQDRLQAGVGVNLMADGADNGRYYFFVGSDLISLLNTIGIGK
jgi:hypothetical protein